MSAPDLEALHRRYVEVAGRFKSAWTFHQFLQGVQKLFAEADLARYPADFSDIHAVLKEVSQNFSNSFAAEKILGQLVQVERQLGQMSATLVNADARITPPLLRQFFDRVKNFDDQVLTQMVRFYLTAGPAYELAGDRLDKVDFLLTKLSEEANPATSALGLRDLTRLREIFQGLWSVVESGAIPPALLEAAKGSFAELRRDVGNAESLAALTERQLIDRHRELKRTLGPKLFHPEILLGAMETNLAFKNKIRLFYRLEEQRIATESQRIFELEGQVPVDGDLDQRLAEFRRLIEQFERKQRRDNVKLGELSFLRRQVEELIPRLMRGKSSPPARPEPDFEEPPTAIEGPVETGEPVVDVLIERYFAQLRSALSETDSNSPAKVVALSREVYGLRLEPREVEAYRRRFESDSPDPELECFLLEAAALRLRINEEAGEITALLDETAVTRDAPVFARGKLTTRLGDAFVQRFAHFIDFAVQESAFAEAQQLQLLRMRLIRDYSGLWLLVNRPRSD